MQHLIQVIFENVTLAQMKHILFRTLQLYPNIDLKLQSFIDFSIWKNVVKNRLKNTHLCKNRQRKNLEVIYIKLTDEIIAGLENRT